MVTAGGAEALPFLASFCVLPASVGFFMLYGKLVRWVMGAATSLAFVDDCGGLCLPHYQPHCQRVWRFVVMVMRA